MSFFAVLLALLIEQVRPLAERNIIYTAMHGWGEWTSSNFDAGKLHHGRIAWTLAVMMPTAMTLAVHWLLIALLGWPAAVLWSIAVLYLTLGFRQFSHHFTVIRDALENADELQARTLLAQWQQVDASNLPRCEIVRHVIEYSVLAAHRHVFGVLAWFSILAAVGLGPTGAVLYRMSGLIARWWQQPDQTQSQISFALQAAAARAWYFIDWLPARITALAFAIVGNFEDAIDCWRNFAQYFPNDNDGVILASTSGALNVRLGGQALKGFDDGRESELEGPQSVSGNQKTPGHQPEIGHLRSVVGLMWRSVVLWLLLLALLTLAHLLG